MAFATASPAQRNIFSLRDTSTAAATTTYLFNIPQDANSIIAKVWLQGTYSATGTATVTFQTSEDGGSTWRDVAASTIGGNLTAATMGNQNAHFIDLGTVGVSDRGVANYIGSVAASTLALAAVSGSAIGTQSGLPMLGTIGRVQVTYTATISTGGVNVDISANTTQFAA